MNDLELADAATTALKQTTVSYPAWHQKSQSGGYPDVKKTQWWKAFDYLSQIGVTTPPPPPPPPPGSGFLPVKPPGYSGGYPLDIKNFSGFTLVNINQVGNYGFDNNKDYFLKCNVDQVAPKNGHRSAVEITGGRNVVIIGGKVKIDSQVVNSNDEEDPSAFIFNDGNPAGTIYVEGTDQKSVNGVTVRTQRQVILQYNRIVTTAFQGDHSSAHSDIIQTWDRGPSKKIYVNYLSARSDYTGFSILMPPDPIEWYMDHVDFQFVPDHTGPGVYYGDSKSCNWHSGETVWFKGGSGECLDDSLAGWGQDNIAYRITSADGTRVYNSPDPPPGGDSPFGNQQGDYITYPKYLPSMKWKFGIPSGGDYVPENKVGTSYVPVMYA